MLLVLRTESLDSYDKLLVAGHVPHWVTDFKDIVSLHNSDAIFMKM